MFQIVIVSVLNYWGNQELILKLQWIKDSTSFFLKSKTCFSIFKLRTLNENIKVVQAWVEARVGTIVLVILRVRTLRNISHSYLNFRKVVYILVSQCSQLSKLHSASIDHKGTQCTIIFICILIYNQKNFFPFALLPPFSFHFIPLSCPFLFPFLSFSFG